jgi:uroporphyrinogen III methyltransferase/synthase
VIGTVYLVGAGPGDPGLLTCAGRDALGIADVVVYDRLAHPDLLKLARSSAEKIFVGKESARHYVRQEDTNRILVDRALAGKTVVRLKGGDPMVFGRGGEEAEFLRSHGVPFVIVPGVTSAIAALTYAGIPITHRDASSSFAVITGHERDDSRESGTRDAGAGEQRRRWDRIAHAADTLVFLMGVENLSGIVENLLEQGRDPQTPVALVQWGTWNKQRSVAGTLETIVEIVRTQGITAPAVTVVGDVVRWRSSLQWFENRPLHGKTVVVTRARHQSSELVETLQRRGALVREFPIFRIAAPSDQGQALASQLQQIATFGWILFTSVNTVDAVMESLRNTGRDSRAFAGIRLAVVGESTATRLRDYGLTADHIAPATTAESLGQTLPLDLHNLPKVFLPQAREADSTLSNILVKRGATVIAVEAYRMEPDVSGADSLRADLANGAIDVVTFASSNTVRAFVEALQISTLPDSVRVVAIGPKTAETAESLLRSPDAIATTATIESLVDAVEALFPAP